MNAAKILLVEDDIFLQDVYNEALTEEGFIVTLAKDGEEALQQLKKGGWDLVLLDIVLPKMTGIDVIKQVKTFSSPPAKHIVFTTNSDESKDLKEVLGLVSGYILKSSFTPDQFVNKVKSYLG